MNELLAQHHLYWAFPIAVSLQQEVRHITLTLHQREVAERQLAATRQRFVLALNQIIDAGFDFYYTAPASNDSNLNPLLKRTVDSVIKTVRSGIHLVVQRVFKNMPLHELTLMAYYLDSMIIPDHPPHEARLAFPLSESTRSELVLVAATVRRSDSTAPYVSALADIFTDIVTESIHYYYHAPTALLTLNRIAKAAADLGMEGVASGITNIIRRVVKDVSHANVTQLFQNLHLMVLARELDYPVAAAQFVAEKMDCAAQQQTPAQHDLA